LLRLGSFRDNDLYFDRLSWRYGPPYIGQRTTFAAANNHFDVTCRDRQGGDAVHGSARPGQLQVADAVYADRTLKGQTLQRPTLCITSPNPDRASRT
jgi:hypothetical protein